MTPLRRPARALDAPAVDQADGPERTRAPECRLPIARQPGCRAVQSRLLTNGPPDTGSFPTPRYGESTPHLGAIPGDTPERGVNPALRPVVAFGARLLR